MSNLLLINLVEGDKVAFANKVIAIAGRLKVNPNWLMATMYSESGLKPTARHPETMATGLIQFMPGTATWLGTSVDALYRMSALEQLDWVEKYYVSFKTKGVKLISRVKEFTDLYLLTFYPKALAENWPDSKPFPPEVWKVNRPLDLNKDQVITVGEFKTWALNRVAKKLPKDFPAEELKKKWESVSV